MSALSKVHRGDVGLHKPETFSAVRCLQSQLQQGEPCRENHMQTKTRTSAV